MAARTVTLDIGINGAFATRRWEDPSKVVELAAGWGYPYLSVCADCLDPNMTGRLGKDGTLTQRAERYREAAQRFGVTLWDYYTGMITHRGHGLASSFPDEVEAMRAWIRGALKLCHLMGIPRLGGHLDAIPVELFGDRAAYAQRAAQVRGHFRVLSAEAGALGITLYNEHMYTPGELPWTLDTAQEFLIEANRDNPHGPVRLTGDVGHHAGWPYAGWGYTPQDADYVAWLERYAAQTGIIHVQQTTPDASHHWPFTDAFNAKGSIRMDAVIEAIRRSLSRYAEEPAAAFVPPVDHIVLIFEYIPGSTQSEQVVCAACEQSARYLRRFIPQGGLVLGT